MGNTTFTVEAAQQLCSALEHVSAAAPALGDVCRDSSTPSIAALALSDSEIAAVAQVRELIAWYVHVGAS